MYIARKYKGKNRFRKNFDTSLFIEDGKVVEEPLVLPYPKIKKKQPKVRPAKINYKPKPPKRKEKKQLEFLDFIEDSSSDEESTSSEYST